MLLGVLLSVLLSVFLPSGTVATLLKKDRLATLAKVKYLIVSVLLGGTVATLLKKDRLATDDRIYKDEICYSE